MDLDPYMRTLNSPMSAPDTPAAETAAALLRTARWHACLSQADVAQRAQTTQPVVARYGAGTRVPNVDVLRRLLASCGMRLDLALTPEPGLIDAPIRDLLAKPPWGRIPEDARRNLEDLVPLLRELGLPVLIASQTAARLRGALVQVTELEFWVDEADVDIAALERALEGIGAVLFPADTRPSFGDGRLPRLALLDGGLRQRDLRIRGMLGFADHLGRAARIDLPVGPVLITGLSDTTLYWTRRDRARLALQRAEKLRQEMAGPALLSG